MADARIPSGRSCPTGTPSVCSPEMVCSRESLRGKGLPDIPTGVSPRRGTRIRRESWSSMTVEALCRRREHRCVTSSSLLRLLGPGHSYVLCELT